MKKFRERLVIGVDAAIIAGAGLVNAAAQTVID